MQYAVPVSIIRAHAETSWDDNQIEFFKDKFDSVPEELERKTIDKWAKTYRLTPEYICEVLDVSLPEPAARKKKQRPRRQAAKSAVSE